MARKKKLPNQTAIPDDQIEAIARCLMPDILAYYNSEDGQKEFAEWKTRQKNFSENLKKSGKAE